MGIFFWRGIEESSFHAREDGDWDFFPNGALTGGHRVNAAQRERIVGRLRGFYAFGTAMILVGLALAAFGGGFERIWPYIIVLLLAIAGYWFFWLRPLWRGLPPAERRLGFREAQTQAVRTMPKWRIIYVLVVGPLFGLLSVFLLWFGVSQGETFLLVTGIVGLVVSAALTWAGLVMLRKRGALDRGGA